MKNKFLYCFSDYQWARRRLEGLWTYYFNDVVGLIWMRRESRNERLPCCFGNSIIKEEDYRLEELYKSYET